MRSVTDDFRGKYIEVLRKWHKDAAKARSIDDLKMAVGLMTDVKNNTVNEIWKTKIPS